MIDLIHWKNMSEMKKSERRLTAEIGKEDLRWFGHVLLMDDVRLLKQVVH